MLIGVGVLCRKMKKPAPNLTSKTISRDEPRWAKEAEENALTQTFGYLKVGVIGESDARPTGVQLKRKAKLFTVIGSITKHADCRISYRRYPIHL